MTLTEAAADENDFQQACSNLLSCSYTHFYVVIYVFLHKITVEFRDVITAITMPR